jgi:hypothetical protein
MGSVVEVGQYRAYKYDGKWTYYKVQERVTNQRYRILVITPERRGTWYEHRLQYSIVNDRLLSPAEIILYT